MNEADLIAITDAIGGLDTANYEAGMAWDNAHHLVMEHEGEAMFDWLHALLHRIEGDANNAAYWYRKAGKHEFAGSFEEEAKAMLAELKKDTD